MRYFLLPLGCATNTADAERIAAVLESAGYEQADDERSADVLGIVACSIRQPAIDRVYGRIRNWNMEKQRRPLTTFVSGCVLEEDKRKFAKLFDIILPLEEAGKLPSYLHTQGVPHPGPFWGIEPVRRSSVHALVPIQNGCNKYCSYCAVPYTRGKEVSRPSADIMKEIQSCLSHGYPQITLLGQNVNSYGLDSQGNEMSFPALLDEIGSLADHAQVPIRVYYTSPHPQDMTAAVFAVQASHPSLANYLNFPLQSGSDEVLRRMNRRYSVDEYFQLLAQARSAMPGLAVSTDFIVGFPGETEQQFLDTLEAAERGNFDMAFIAQYSERPGTLAHQRYPDTIPHEEKKRRDDALTAVIQASAEQHNRSCIGSVVPVVVERRSRKAGKLLGRTEGLKSVEFESTNTDLIGTVVDIKINNTDPWRLSGSLLSSGQSPNR